jgi:hypothetical protein
MSLLSDTQGRPERVRSLLRLLDALGGRASRDEVDTWMMPGSFRDTEKSLSQVNQTVGCARSLGLVEDDGDALVLSVDPVPSDMQVFLDLVHARLCDPQNEADNVLFRAYACVVLETARTGNTDWLAKPKTITEIAPSINRILAHGESDQRVFNTTKAPPWRVWMVALGLAVEGGNALPYLFPQPAERLTRELPAIADAHGRGVEIPAATFMAEVARRMPYLDGGQVYARVAAQFVEVHRWQSRAGRVTNVVSEALRDLHDEGTIELIARADAADALSLHHEIGSPLRSFVGVIIRDGAGQ